MSFAMPILASMISERQEHVAISGPTMNERVTRLEKLAESWAPVPAELGRLTERIGAVEGRLGVVEVRLGSVEVRLGDVESRIVQLRTHMNTEFSAVRGALAATKDELREDIAAQGRETAAGFLQIGSELRGLHLKLDRLLLKGQ